MICLKYWVLFFLILFVIGVQSYLRFGEDPAPEYFPRKVMGPETQFFRSRRIVLPSARPNKNIGERIEFQLFDGESVIGVVNHIVDRGEDIGGTWAGILLSSQNTETMKGHEDWFTLSCFVDACTAHLEMQSQHTKYLIMPVSETKTYELEGSNIFLLAEVIGTQSEHRFHPSHIKDVSAFPNVKEGVMLDDLSHKDKDLIIDIGVIYTPKALAYMGNSVSALKSRIYLANDEANQIFERSGVELRSRIVFCLRTANASFVEPDPEIDFQMLYWLTDIGDGYLDEVHDYRDKYGADFIILVNYDNVGAAWVNKYSKPYFAFANHAVNYMDGWMWMHAMGHLMGCYRDRFTGPLDVDPEWDGYGHCWEDSSKTDCTCYSSVMAKIGCITLPNYCGNCTQRNYLANHNVEFAGNPTGIPTANCGLHIHRGRYTPITYRDSIQSGGIINSVSPPAVLISLCSTVNITGWMLSFGPGDRVVSVTLAGVPATILSQTNHTVFVRAPNVTSPSIRAGDVIVTSKLGRVTISRGTFKFSAMEGYYTTDLSSMSVDKTVWSSTGTGTWTIQPFGGLLAFKGNFSKDTDVAELITTRLLTATASRPCYDEVKSVSFKYWSNSSYPNCFDKVTLSAKTETNTTWAVVWTGTLNNYHSDVHWLNSSTIVLPDDTRQVKFNVYTVDFNNCRFWTPLYLTNISLHLSTRCVGYKCPGLAYALPPPPNPTLEPTMIPTVTPTSQPTLAPTVLPNNTAIFSLSGPVTFDGKTTYLKYPSLSYNITDKFTLSLWINSQSTRAYLMSLGRTVESDIDELVLQLNNRWVYFWDYGRDITGNLLKGFSLRSRPLILGTRQHLAIVRRLNIVTMFINGVFEGKITALGSIVYKNKDFYLGADLRLKSNYFNGTMDHVAVYSDALTSTQIFDLYSEQLNPPPTLTPITSSPSVLPTVEPSTPTGQPTSAPSSPSVSPTPSPTALSTTSLPSNTPTASPTFQPSKSPTTRPSASPTATPVRRTNTPSVIPSITPTASPTPYPTLFPRTSSPSKVPTANPTSKPVPVSPSSRPSVSPTSRSRLPTKIPTAKPSTFLPSLLPSKRPTSVPSRVPSKVPTNNPSVAPSKLPTIPPTKKPSIKPSRLPSKIPTNNPSVALSKIPTIPPTKKSSIKPSRVPSKLPTNNPTVKKANVVPTLRPTALPSIIPSTKQPSSPTALPSAKPTA